MTSAVAVLTYRRAFALKVFLDGLLAHTQYPTAIFEDCANTDNTCDILKIGAVFKGLDPELDAEVWEHPKYTAFLGRRNLGVAGNSNRAMRWFSRLKRDHLCLCNDDLEVKGDFVQAYRDAHKFFKVGLFCFTDFEGDAYKTVDVKIKGKPLKILTRMTGIMMSMTSEVIDKIGYYDTYCSKFGNEHCDFNNRARFAGFVNLNGQPQVALDIPVSTLLVHQDVPSSVYPFEAGRHARDAEEAMAKIGARYEYTEHFRPFRLSHGRWAASYNDTGIPIYELERMGYELIVDYDLKDQHCLA